MKAIFKLSTLALLAATLFASCAKEMEAPQEEILTVDGARVFTLTIEPGTKVAVTDAGKTTWEAGDQILVHGNGSWVATLAKEDILNDGKTAIIKAYGVEPLETEGYTSTFYALYPASAAAEGDMGNKAAFKETNALLMAAYNEGSKFIFKNLAGLITFTATGDYDKYVFSGNAEETVGYTNFQAQLLGGETPVLNYAETTEGALKTIEGTLAEGTNIIALPAGVAFEKGFSFKFYKGDVIVKEAATEKPVTVGRGQILPLGDISDHIEDYVEKANGTFLLDLNNPDMAANVEFGAGEAFDKLTNYTVEIRYLPRTYSKVKTGWARRLMQFHNGSEQENIMLRFGDGNTAAGVLQVSGRYDGNVNITAEPFVANEWTTLTITGDGSTARVYNNGIEIYSGASTKVLTPKAIEFCMSWDDGTGYPAGQVFDGLLDYIRIWNVTRSKSEIQAGLCSVDPNAEGLLANFIFEGKTKPTAVKDEAHNLTLDFANAYYDRSGGKDVDITPYVAAQWSDYTETICDPNKVYPEHFTLSGNFTAASDGKSISLTQNGITVTQKQNDGQSAIGNYRSATTLRLYAGHSIEFTATDKLITKIQFTNTSSYAGANGITANTGKFVRQTNCYWEGESNNIIITNTGTNSTQFRPTKIVIYYIDKPAEPEPEKVLTIERAWGKYSTADASWNAYYGGAAGGERNVALDEEYVYIPETGTGKLWAISVADPDQVKAVNVTSVTAGGTFAVSCPRVLKNTDASINGGKDVLVVSNMLDGDPTLYFYHNGIDAPAKVVKANTWASRRLGDTFTYAGTLQKGVFFFKDFNSVEGTVTFPMTFSDALENLYLSARLVAPAVAGAGSYFPYPDDMANGVSSVRGSGVAQLVATTADFQTAEGAVTPTLTDLSGYYTDAAFRFFEFNGKRYIAYTRQVDSSDGRLFIIDGELTDSWASILQNRHVVYHAAIQNSTEQDAAPGDPSPKASGNSGMDLDIHEINGDIYIAVVKQNVGLSLFKVYMK